MIIGSKIISVRNIDSTNTYAAGLLKSGTIPEGTIVFTNYQTAGRGQKGNRWESEDGMNLLFSIILYPGMVSPVDQFIISMFISLGIRDFLIMLIPQCTIKWPNDIYCGDDKIAGILIENSVTGMEIINCVAGIGLNVNQTDFPGHIPNPVSLKMLTGNEHDPDLCLHQLAGFMDRRYKQLISGHIDDIRNEYISSLYRLNEWHRFNSAGGYFSGKIISVSDSGRLIIEKRNGKLHEFSFKEVDFKA